MEHRLPNNLNMSFAYVEANRSSWHQRYRGFERFRLYLGNP